MPKILIIGSHPEQMLNFRGDLIRHLQNRGHEVLTASPAGTVELDQRFAAWGVRRFDLAMDRTGVSVGADLRLLWQIRRLLREQRPDAVLAYTIKPVVYGALAGWLGGRPAMIAMITGLGAAFSKAASLRQWLVRASARTLYRAAMCCTDAVIFQNQDDESDFRRLGLLRQRQLVAKTPGSGVNLKRFAKEPLPDAPIRFLMISRLLVDKGVREYIAAAASLRRKYPEVRCHLVGPYDSNPSALSRHEVESAVADASIVYEGFARDVRPHLRSCHVYVLPSYREGTPRSVLEALATGRPVITTDAPGCRETVIKGSNGLLVPVGKSDALAQAMMRLIEMPRRDLVAMADASRDLAEVRFDVHHVNQQVQALLERALLGKARQGPSRPS